MAWIRLSTVQVNGYVEQLRTIANRAAGSGAPEVAGPIYRIAEDLEAEATGHELRLPADGAEPDRAAEYERARRERLEGAGQEVMPDETP